MARAKQKAHDDGAETVAAPSPEPAVAAPGQGDEELLPDLPRLRSIGEDDSSLGPARGSGWAMPALAGAIIVLLMLYGLSIRPTETTDALPSSPEPVAASPDPVAASSAPATAPARRSTRGIPARTATAGGAKVIQLASFYSRARAERYWREVQPRVKGLAKLRHSVVEGSVKGRTVYRLRASGRSAFDICDRMHKARIACLRIGH